jgi:hypothetical protein
MFIPENIEVPQWQEAEADIGISRTDAVVLGVMALLAVCVAFAPDDRLPIAANRVGLPWGGLIIALLIMLSLVLASLMVRHALKQKRLVKPIGLNLGIPPEPVFSKTS